MAADHAHNGEIPVESAPPESGAPRASGANKKGNQGLASAKASSPTSTSDKVAATTRETIRTLKMSSVGIELALSVVIGLLVGRWLDGQLGTSPWLMIVLLCLGFAAGLRSIVRTMDRASRASDEAAAAAPASSTAPAGEAGTAGESQTSESGGKPDDESGDKPDDRPGPAGSLL